MESLTRIKASFVPIEAAIASTGRASPNKPMAVLIAYRLWQHHLCENPSGTHDPNLAFGKTRALRKLPERSQWSQYRGLFMPPNNTRVVKEINMKLKEIPEVLGKWMKGIPSGKNGKLRGSWKIYLGFSMGESSSTIVTIKGIFRLYQRL